MSAVKLLKPVHSGMNELNKVWSEVCLGFFFFCTERSYGFAPTYQLSYVWKAEELIFLWVMMSAGCLMSAGSLDIHF